MFRFRPRLPCIFAVLIVLATAPVGAQENLDSGKSAAQLFASDCAICHKTPQGVARSGGPALVEFLREHYTASRESAAALAAYLQSAGRGPAAPARATKQSAKGDGAKGAEKKPAAGKPSVAKSHDAKSAGAKTSKAKASEPKASEPKSSEPKAGDAKSSDPKPADGAKPE